MSGQYTPHIESAQTYLAMLHKETITRQEQEMGRLRHDLAKAHATIRTLSSQVRDLELDITMCEPRQIIEEAPLLATKTQRIKQMAAKHGVSEATAWRKVKDGTWAM